MKKYLKVLYRFAPQRLVSPFSAGFATQTNLFQIATEVDQNNVRNCRASNIIRTKDDNSTEVASFREINHYFEADWCPGEPISFKVDSSIAQNSYKWLTADDVDDGN